MTTDLDGQQNLTALATAVDEAEDALERLKALTELLDVAKILQQAVVAQARESGASWAAVGRSAGITKQGAAGKWGPSSPKRAEDTGTAARAAMPSAPEWELRTIGPRGGLRVGRIVLKRP